MRRIGRVCTGLLIAAATSCGSTSGALVSLPFRAGGQTAGPLTFTTQTGWTVTLQKAQIALGPFYFNNVSPSTQTFRNGLVIVQVTRQIVLDVLNPVLQDVPGGADGESGHAVAVEIDLFPPDPTQPSPVRAALGNDVGIVAGTASKGGTTVQFSGPITIDTNLVTPTTPLIALQQVRGAVVDLDFAATPQVLELRVDPTHWFDQADFSQLTNGTWGVHSTFLNQLVQGVQRETDVYSFTLVPR